MYKSYIFIFYFNYLFLAHYVFHNRNPLFIQYRYLVFDPPGLGTRHGYTLWFGLVRTVYPGLGVKDQISILYTCNLISKD